MGARNGISRVYPVAMSGYVLLLLSLCSLSPDGRKVVDSSIVQEGRSRSVETTKTPWYGGSDGRDGGCDSMNL